jgi:glycerol kinase
MQFLADMVGAQVDRPEIFETTALGAGYLAGWQAGLYPDPEQFSLTWRRQASFRPSMAASERESRYRGWREAVARTILRPEI